jgi:hypothetical protein
MAVFKKEQYEKIADVIRELGPSSSKEEVSLAFTRMLSMDNKSFFAHMFIDACDRRK